MEFRILSYDGFEIIYEENEEKGIFFRSPIQKIYYDNYYDDTNTKYYNIFSYLNKYHNNIFYHILGNLLCNCKAIKQFENNISNKNQITRLRLNNIVFPIYFKRKFRRLTANNLNSHSTINTLYSYGYESIFNDTKGKCKKEKTIIKSKGCKKQIKLKQIDSPFVFTNINEVKKIIKDTQNLVI